MSHPSLGEAPRDMTAGFPAAAERIRAARSRLGARALEVALERDPSIADRHGELGLRKLLRDTEPLIDRVAIAVASNDRTAVSSYADWVAPLYRRRRVPLDDLVHLCHGLKAAVPSMLSPEELTVAEQALDEAIRVFLWNRRIAGDARKRNRLLNAIYKGA
ncbi:MAG TPA: hypothetical protein VKA85_12195 [Candidatus Limnocylindrales bacterium]|nr:hypothetical protein [Candidatus Limnocylindrales bacterium]